MLLGIVGQYQDWEIHDPPRVLPYHRGSHELVEISVKPLQFPIGAGVVGWGDRLSYLQLVHEMGHDPTHEYATLVTVE